MYRKTFAKTPRFPEQKIATQCFHNDLLADLVWITLIPWLSISHLQTTIVIVTQNSSCNLYVDDSMLDTLHESILWIVTMIWDSCYFYPHYTNEETEAQRSTVTWTICGKVRMLTWSSRSQKPSLTSCVGKLALPVRTKAMGSTQTHYSFSKWRFQPGSPSTPPGLVESAFCGDSFRKKNGQFHFGFSSGLLLGSQDPGRTLACQRDGNGSMWSLSGEATSDQRSSGCRATSSSRTMVLNWEWLCPLGNILAMSRDTFELSQRGRGCYWHLVGWSQRCC